MLDDNEVVVGRLILLDVLLQLVDVLLLAQAKGTLGGTVLSSALCVREFTLSSSLLAGGGSVGVGVGGISMGMG